MPRRDVRTSKRAMGFLSFLIAVAVLSALGLVCAIVLQDRARPVSTDAVTDPGATSGPVGDGFVDANAMADSEIVLQAPSYSEPAFVRATLEPGVTPTPRPTATPKPTMRVSDPSAPQRPVAAAEGMLPVFSKAFTEEKVIAITVDECSGVKITQQFLELAQKYGAKLTLFPCGENVMKAGMADVMRLAVFQLGFEIENRGYDTISRIYKAPDTVMVQEIWKQSVAVNFVLGMKYAPHFYRLYGGLGENDRRTHAYLMQEGYMGVAHWTCSCTGMKASRLKDRLTPGGIYAFRTTPEDGELLRSFLEYAQGQGYRMVTLNELFGYPANEYHAIEGSLLSEKMPAFSYDVKKFYDIYPGEASWAVYNMQLRLAELGYLLPHNVDGIFGEVSSDALRMFQAQTGKPASGAADVTTLKTLYADDAPRNPVVLDTPTPAPGELWEEGELVPSETEQIP